jgi:hypothetical protein
MAILNADTLRCRKMAIDLRGPKGNAFFLLGIAKDLSRKFGLDFEDIQARMKSGDYENLINVFDTEFGEYVDLYH